MESKVKGGRNLSKKASKQAAHREREDRNRQKRRRKFEKRMSKGSRIAGLENLHGNLVNEKEACAYLGISRQRLFQLAATGKIARPLPGFFGSRSLIARVRSQADVIFVFDEDMNVLGKKEGSQTVPASQAELKAAGLYELAE